MRLYDFELQDWSQLNGMNTERHGHGCGRAQKSDGTVSFVVAGGYSATNPVSSVEILEMIDGNWK